ncbi:MAG: hypothetical protein WBF51_04310 [Candidatus Dormiibacterota bacterium]
MTRVTQNGVVTAGAAIRRQFRRALREGCLELGVGLNLDEDKGWFDSQFMIELTGEEAAVDRIVEWIGSVQD